MRVFLIVCLMLAACGRPNTFCRYLSEEQEATANAIVNALGDESYSCKLPSEVEIAERLVVDLPKFFMSKGWESPEHVRQHVDAYPDSVTSKALHPLIEAYEEALDVL